MKLIRCAQAAGLGVGILLLAGCPGPPPPPPLPPVTPTPVPSPTPTPPPYVPNRKTDLGRIFNGLQYRVTLETQEGTTATHDRGQMDSYVADLTVKVKVPKAHHDLEEIKRLNAALPEILPGLSELLETAKISPGFDNLYRVKCASLQSNLMRLDNLLSRHNFFDCETILELQQAKTKRRAVLIQADMDVDTDGSDPDRVPVVDDDSPTFQPVTSYRWARKTANPSPFMNPREAKLKQYQAELAGGGPSAARRAALKEAVAELNTDIADLKRFSFLIGATDPFIVIPGGLYGKTRGPFAPAVGDYCVVAYGNMLYPAIVGDVGPANVIGEASLRICKEINGRANSENRPVSDLKVTYLIFPGTAEKMDAPRLEHWHDRCEKLLEEIGGHAGTLFVWEDLTRPKATPVPPTPAPATPGLPTPALTTPSGSSPSPAPKPTPIAKSPAPATPAVSPTPAPVAPSSPSPKPSATPKHEP